MTVFDHDLSPCICDAALSAFARPMATRAKTQPLCVK
jgi:hypothetical protein